MEARESAMLGYSAAANRLDLEALKCDRSRRPIAAAKLRNQARIARRAAKAERVDPPPDLWPSEQRKPSGP